MKPGWEVKRLDDVCVIVNGGTPKSGVAAYWDGKVNWLTPKDMGQMEDRYIGHTPRTISESGLQNSSARLVPANSVILSTRAPIGHLAINSAPMAFNQGCRGLVPSQVLDTNYLYYFLFCNKSALDALGTGATFKELSSGALKSFKIPLPPLEEQQRIVAILDEAFEGLDRARANAEANLQSARELFDNALSAFMGNNEEWVDYSFADKSVLKIIDGDRGANYPKKSEFLNEGHCLFLSTKNVRPNGFDFTEAVFISEKRDALLRKGKLNTRDVVLTTRGTIGNVAIFDETVPYEHIRINSGMLILRPNEEKLRAEFLFELLRSAVIRDQINEHVSGTAQPQLPIRSLVKFRLPAPKDVSIQMDVTDKIRIIGAEVEALQVKYKSEIADLDDLRQSLLQKAFAGELT